MDQRLYAVTVTVTGKSISSALIGTDEPTEVRETYRVLAHSIAHARWILNKRIFDTSTKERVSDIDPDLFFSLRIVRVGRVEDAVGLVSQVYNS